MTNIVKKSIYNTVGVISIAQNKFKELVEELIQNGHFTEDEGKRIIDTFFFDLRARLDEKSGGLQARMEDFIQKWNIVDINQAKKDFDAMVNNFRNNPFLPVKMNKRN